MLNPRECRGCEYYDKHLWLCGYAEKTGKTRIAQRGGDYTALLEGPCLERKQRKRPQRSGEAWRVPTVKKRRKRRSDNDQ